MNKKICLIFLFIFLFASAQSSSQEIYKHEENVLREVEELTGEINKLNRKLYFLSNTLIKLMPENNIQ